MQLETTANNMQANERQKRRAATSIFSLIGDKSFLPDELITS